MKLLIADDDEQIRSGIEEGIDWSALDIQQVLTASNGIEALEHFKKFLPEIVVTDVRMPGIDGLELLKRVKEIKPQTRVLILSGFNDFEYLKKAIQLDAIDYEMKPIRARNLIALIQKIKEDIIKERVDALEFQKYLESHKRKFAEEFLSGMISDRLILLEGLKQYYGFDATETFICLIAEVDGNLKTNPQLTKNVTDRLCYLFESSDLYSMGICLKIKEGQVVFLLKTGTESYLFYRNYVNELTYFMREWNREVKDSYKLSFSAGISSQGNISDFSRLKEEAMKSLALRFYNGYNSIQVYDPSKSICEKSISGLPENPEFISHVSKSDFNAVLPLIKNEFDRFKMSCTHTGKAVSSYTRDLLQILKVTARSVPTDLIESIQSKIEFIEENEDFLLIEDCKVSVLTAFEEMATRLAKNLSPVMVRAEEYIRKNYTSDLTVETLSEYVGKTPNYFSHLFKREFGISFKEYVNRLRISKAKELIIQTNDLIYEISEKVGFSDYNYFTQVYKKIEGYSPGTLRKHGGVKDS